WSMRSLRGCESQPHRSRSVSAGEAVSTHPLSSPTCSEVGESRGSFVEQVLLTCFQQASAISLGV
ncbi:hypothetical protein PN462_01800, partial [Spirulina sp. CS-785/01]|uniref:hypothetical protein n=1 Tax=Spirulina sp. CS-785/01 TaxID=3021716 RepID=UPI0023310A9E